MNTVLATIHSIATTVIAGCAVVLTFRSGQDNREKIRLDLFNRRFSIYQRVLVCHQALIVWNDTDEQKALIPPFIEASREALFIFPKNSGVYGHLQKMCDHSWRITRHQELMAPFFATELYGDEEMKKQRRNLLDKRMESVTWMISSMAELENLMKKSMSFERL
jgi:hypothetical protein